MTGVAVVWVAVVATEAVVTVDRPKRLSSTKAVVTVDRPKRLSFAAGAEVVAAAAAAAVAAVA